MIGERMSCIVTINDDMLLTRVNTVEGARYRQSKELGKLNSTVKRYKDENAKLRELVQRMRRYMAGAIEHCGYDVQTTGYTMLGSRLEECEDAMRELEIEVN